jgi:hypothetical protein
LATSAQPRPSIATASYNTGNIVFSRVRGGVVTGLCDVACM